MYDIYYVIKKNSRYFKHIYSNIESCFFFLFLKCLMNCEIVFLFLQPIMKNNILNYILYSIKF